MRDRYAFADGRAADRLSFEQSVEQFPGVQRTFMVGQLVGHFLKHASLVLSLEIGNDPRGSQKVGDLQDFTLLLLSCVLVLYFRICCSTLSIKRSMAA